MQARTKSQRDMSDMTHKLAGFNFYEKVAQGRFARIMFQRFSSENLETIGLRLLFRVCEKHVFTLGGQTAGLRGWIKIARIFTK